MPVISTTTFDVRFDECDPYGHVNHAVYLRYIQEATFRAWASAGFNVDRYDAIEHAWSLQEADIEYLAPLHYGERVAVTTWAVDFRRESSRRAYELHDASSGEPVARAMTDWIYPGTDGRRPASAPAEWVNAFLPEETAGEIPPRQPFPDAPAPPPGLFCQERHVEWADMDLTGHLNGAAYLRYMEDCAMQDAHSRGWSVSRMLDEGFAIVARRYRIRFLHPVVQGCDLKVCTWIANVRRVTAERHYMMLRAADEKRLARAWARWAWIGPESGRPVRIPEAFIADFAENIVA